jgi:hypothetical protein
MTAKELRERFPNVSDDVFRLTIQSKHENPDDHRPGIRPLQPQSDERVSLDAAAQGEEARWYASARRFEIVFTVYSRRPCDWDGYDIKALQDFLIKAGVIPDDGWATLSGRVVSCKAATEAEEKTVIEISPV